jgi:hypothetical protein
VKATRFALWWVAWYTRGLPEGVRADRRAEIASDLWEQRVAGGSGQRLDLAVLSRCVRGMAADVSWRRARRRPGWIHVTRAALRLAGWSVALLAYLFLAGVYAFVASPVVGIEPYGDDWAPGDVTWYSRVTLLLLGLLVAGGALLPRRPPLAIALLAVAIAGACVVFWWAAPIYAAVGATALSGAVTYTRRRRTPAGRVRW